MADKAFREFNAANYPAGPEGTRRDRCAPAGLAESQNLRGVILMRQAEYDQAEAALQKALATDPEILERPFQPGRDSISPEGVGGSAEAV